MPEISVGAPAAPQGQPQQSAPVAANDNAARQTEEQTDLGNFHGAEPANDNAGNAPTSAMPEVIDAKNLDALSKVKVKGIVVNGEEVELPLAEALKHARLGTAAFRKFDEAKQMREEAQRKEKVLADVVQKAADDPLGFVRKLGAKTQEKLYRQVYEEIRREQLPEPERKALDLEERERQLAERDRRLREAEEKRQRDEQERAAAQQAEQAQRQILGQMISVMDKAGFAPVTGDATARKRAERLRAECVERMAIRLNQALDVGAQVTLQDVFEEAVDEMRGIAGGFASRLGADELAQLLGDQKVAELRKREIDRLQQSQAPAPSQPRQADAPPKPRPQPAPKMPDLDKINPRDWSAHLTRLARGR
jgi:hypothetical protein